MLHSPTFFKSSYSVAHASLIFFVVRLSRHQTCIRSFCENEEEEGLLCSFVCSPEQQSVTSFRDRSD